MIDKFVDPTLPRHVLVLHGVQEDEAADLEHDKYIRDLLVSRGVDNVGVPYEVSLFEYESVNDAHQGASRLKKAFTSIGSALALGQTAGKASDVVTDVLIALEDGSTARKIKDRLTDRILELAVDQNRYVILVAHSLGSVYGFDVVNDLMRDPRFFHRSTRKNWPLQAFVSMGSPIGLSMFDRSEVEPMQGDGNKWFRWFNFWCRHDPIVSGSLFASKKERVAEDFIGARMNGWYTQDIIINTGKKWIEAHQAYWQDPMIGDAIIGLLTR